MSLLLPSCRWNFKVKIRSGQCNAPAQRTRILLRCIRATDYFNSRLASRADARDLKKISLFVRNDNVVPLRPFDFA